MRKACLVSIALLASFPLPAQEHATLQSYIGRKRVLLIFAPNQEDAQLRVQQREVEQHADDLVDYDLAVVGMPLKMPPRNHAVPPTMHTVDAAEQALARKRFHLLPNDFTVILLGKDGGEKLRSHQPIAFSKLNATIDTMPMRQEEIRARHR